MNNAKTHFGFEEVPVHEKSKRVRGVFDSVAARYDVMNDAMSLCLHRLWKRQFVAQLDISSSDIVIDVAAGTGDIASLIYPRLQAPGHIFVTDVNQVMLERGRNCLTNKGMVKHTSFTLADAEHLPFADNSADIITIAYGLRNVTDKLAALKDMHRVLKPHGQLGILEFSELQIDALKGAYDWYSFKVLPWLGERLVQDKASYEYLAESIRKHPNQEALLKLMQDAGFVDSHYTNLSGGVTAIHTGRAT